MSRLIEPEGRWTQGHYARDAAGRSAGYTTDAAVCFCVEGAIKRIAGRGRKGERIIQFFSQSIGGQTNAHRWNDATGRKQTEVVAALRSAADLAEGKS